MLTREALQQFLTAKEGQRRKAGTIEFYRTNIGYLLAWMQEKGFGDSLAAVTPAVVDGFMAYEASRIAAPTLHGRYRALNAFFGWCESRKDLKRYPHRRSSPMNEVEPPFVPKSEQKAIEFDDWVRLLRAIDMSSWLAARDYLIVTTLFLSGIRMSELIRLRVEDFDLKHGVLRICEGKRGDFELVPLLEPVARAFMAYLFVRPRWPTTEICLSADGGWMAPIGVLTRSGLTQLLRGCASAPEFSAPIRMRFVMDWHSI